MLRREDTVNGKQPEFWQKTRIDVLARRWGALVGPDRVTVVSLANAPRDFVLRTFEQLTGLPEGTLIPDPRSDNVSLSHPLAEVIRQFNARYFRLDGATADAQAALIEFGAIRRLREHPELLRADDRIEVPSWAADRAGELMRDMIDGIRDAGVRTLGDLDALTVPSRAPVRSVETPAAVSTEAAAELLIGMMLASGRGVPSFARLTGRTSEEELDGAGTRQLVGYTARRVLRRAGGALRRR